MTDAKPLINVIACDSTPSGVVLLAYPVKGTLDILPDKLVFTPKEDWRAVIVTLEGTE